MAAAVPPQPNITPDWVNTHRALGAPLLFVVEGPLVSLWQMRSNAPPHPLERLLPLDAIPDLFKRHHHQWQPDAIHRAKAIGAVHEEYQLDFVDLGLMPAVEGRIHAKLDRLLTDTLNAAHAVSHRLDPKLLFRTVFRLLAAKVLQDRGHPHARRWDSAQLPSVLSAIESYYSLAPIPGLRSPTASLALSAAWDHLRHGLNFCNISSDDLAFVYENTLVTPAARRTFGTHSTPRQVAEYAVSRLQLHHHDARGLSIYEPFAGAGTFLISALRHLRDLLPADSTDQQRHELLVQRLTGDEIDPFACEVAILSLILADYPNHNGWRIRECDLFQNGLLRSRMEDHNVILCNPPFENFSQDERSNYALTHSFYSKPAAVLNAALDAHPLALAFVLPRAFLLHRQFLSERRRVEALYGAVELVALPDRVFAASKMESAVLLAREPRPAASKVLILRSTEVSDHDRATFLASGQTTTERHHMRPVLETPRGDLWIEPLAELWHYLECAPRLTAHFTVHRGLEWRSAQGDAWSRKPQADYRAGLHTARGARQFVPGEPVFLDCRQERLRGGAVHLPWDRPKLVMNAGRLSRRAWRIAVAFDDSGLLCSQQFCALWPRAALTDAQFLAFAALLNGPVANAYLAARSPDKGLRISAIKQIPVPATLPLHVGTLVADYLQHCSGGRDAHSGAELEDLLTLIDATALGAYDLPPRLEQRLLRYFRGAARPVEHSWRHWDEQWSAPGLTLSERASGGFRPHGSWVLEVFQPLPPAEAALLRTYGA